MEVQHARCAGIDVHKKSITVCVLIREVGRREQKYLGEFGTTTAEILRCADWLGELGVTHVAMESTGVCWRPIWNLMEGQFDLLLANATHIKHVPGRKTDVKDSEWLAQLLQHGLLKPSFVPDTGLRDLREISRDRTSLVAERSRLKNRIQKILEEANIKLASVASDVLGKSGRAMLSAMVEGKQDPEQLAELAQGTLRLKIPQLTEALRGRIRAVHRFRLKQQLDRIDFIESQLAELEAEIERQNAPFEAAVTRLAEIPGFDRVTAWECDCRDRGQHGPVSFGSSSGFLGWGVSWQSRECRQAPQREDSQRKSMVATETLPKRLEFLPIPEKLLRCLLSANRC